MNFDVDNQALCQQTDPEIFFPNPSRARNMTTYVGKEMVYSSIVALDACNRCPMQKECLQFAVNNREAFGIWGGTFVHERARVVDMPKGQPIAIPFHTNLRKAVLEIREDLVCPDLPKPDPDFIPYDPMVELRQYLDC